MKTKYILIPILFLLSNNAGAQTSSYHYESGYSAADSLSSSTTQPGATLRLFPTVAKSYVNIYVQSSKPRPFKVGIYDISNKLVKEWDGGANASYEKSLDVTGMQNGRYYIKITFANGSLRQSFTVAH
jgi:hypothetical protein